MKYRKGVFIVTYIKQDNKAKYLILKRRLHWKGWEFPKGGIEKEPIKQAITRELKEETGQTPLKITNHKITGKYLYHKELKDRRKIHGQTYSLYSAELKNKDIKVDKKEHSDYKWVTFNKAIKKLTWPNQRRCLKIVNKTLQ